MLWLVIGTVVLAVASVGLVLWYAHVSFWRWRLASTPAYDSSETLVMPDGGLIELRRLGAGTREGPQGECDETPLLLIHGLAMNHRNHDTHPDYSFARYMQAQGRDVWLVTLRSGRRSFRLFSAANQGFAAMVKYDLPGAVAAVLARSRQRKLDLGVFSMGGMLVYAGLERTLEARFVRRVCVFASPAKIKKLPLASVLQHLPPSLVPVSALTLLTHTCAFMPRLVPNFLLRQLYNPKNVERSVERGMLMDVWENIPGRLGSDFLRWSARGEVTVDGLPVLGGLSRTEVPACFFAGKVDMLAPEWTVRAGYEAWGRDVPHVEKHFVLLSRAHGTRFDYGHCDIAFGSHAREEVFVPAARFLNEGVFPAPRRALSALSSEPSYEGMTALAE